MKPKNVVLRRRLAYVESQLEAESLPSRHSPRLKEERQRRLVEEKIHIQRSLASIVYPILTLPVEVTAEIFVHCLPAKATQPSGKVAPMLLGGICRQWRDIACSTPRLWAALAVLFWGGLDFELLVQEWLRRARATPISLNLQLPFDRCSNSFFATLGRCLCPSSFPFTEHWANLSSFHGSWFTPAECLTLLSRAPRLAHCTITVLNDGSLPSNPASRLVLARLEHLSVTTNDLNIHSLILLLDCLTLPALHSLKITSGFRRFTDTLFLSFLERAPHIQVFDICCYESQNDGVLPGLLSAMPNLTSLRLVASGLTIFDILLSLKESTTFLPSVQHIDFSGSSLVQLTDSDIQTFVDALTTRWQAKSGIAQLMDFNFLHLKMPLHPRIIAFVSKLKEEGMDIFVGHGNL